MPTSRADRSIRKQQFYRQRLVALARCTVGGALVLVAPAFAQTSWPERSVGNQATEAPPNSRARADDTPADILSADQWQRTDAAVNRALEWLAAQQQPDGSFPTVDMGQPGVTGLCLLAFMSHGHVPGEGGIYGERLARATDFVASCQKENGLITLVGPDGPQISRDLPHVIGVTSAYNHGIGSLVMSEAYGMSDVGRSDQYRRVILRALATTLEMQRWPKELSKDRGGWRYVDEYDEHDSDLSITGWNLMFLRSARNAGFEVSKEPIDEAVAYVRRCYAREFGVFEYVAGNRADDDRSRAMAGAGILALAHAGFHGAPEAKRSGEFILRHNFDLYNGLMPFGRKRESSHDRYHYSLFNCCQGMYQLGGDDWRQFFPRTVETLLANQRSDGSWPADEHAFDAQFGNAYTTALVVMTLGAPNQLLPIFQR
jgi:hypothetical protein